MQRDHALVALVNDDVAFLKLLDTLLRHEAGVDTLLLQVSEIAHERIKQQLPDLIALDISIDQPSVNWGLIDLLLHDPATSSIPVLVCSAVNPDLHQREEKLRAAGYSLLEKPFELDELLSHVRSLLLKRHGENRYDGRTRNGNA